MNHTLLQLKAALTALGVTLTTILGWKGILSLIWVIAMGIDYLSGTLAAMKNHEWSSETARSGLWLGRMRPKDREIFLRYYYCLQTAVEIAAALHMPSSTVRSRLVRGRKALAKALGKEVSQ